MIWDFTPDMMHIIKTFIERLVLGVEDKDTLYGRRGQRHVRELHILGLLEYQP
jgi:hypothetical protein